MFTSEKGFLRCLCAVTGFVFIAFSAVGDVLTVPSGSEITLTGSYSEEFTVNGVTVENKLPLVLDFAGDATLKFKYPEGAEDRCAYFGIIATNGTLTVDLTEAVGEFALDSGASAKGNGKIRVKGRNSLRVGSDEKITENNFAPPADIVNVEYVDSDGVAYSDPEGLILTGRVLEWALPENSPWELADNARPCIVHNGSKIVESMMENGVVALKNRVMWIYEPDVFPSSTTPVSVGEGSELVIIYRSVNEDDYFSQGGYSGLSFDNPVSVAEGGVLNLRSHNLHVKGAITGDGHVRYTETRDYPYFTEIYDATEFTGSFSCEWPDTTLRFRHAGFGSDDVAFSLCDGSTVEFGSAVSEGGYTGGIGVVTGPESGSAQLVLPTRHSGKMSIGAVGENVGISGGGYSVTEVELRTLEVGKTLNSDCGTFRLSLTEDIKTASDVFVLTRTNGRNVYLRSNSASSVDFLGFDIPETGDYKLTARKGVSYQNVPENVHVTVPEGVSAELALQHNARANVRMEGGSLSLAYAEPTWKSKVGLWIDPSDIDTVTETNGYYISVQDDLWVKGVTYPTIGGMTDARAGYEVYTLDKPSTTVSTWPLLVTNGLNGMNFISMGYQGLGNRRLRILKDSEYGPSSFAFAIMVFGSQFGGGKAVIANEQRFFQRGGDINLDTHDRISHTNSIFANGDIDTWVNGEQVDPSVRGLSGGWEILSFDTSGAYVHGLGYNGAVGTTVNTKGQNYGEVLLFSEMPTAEERIAAERYLAEKWGLSGDYQDATDLSPEVHVDGDGDIVLKGDIRMTGAYSGTVSLNGKTLSVPDEAVPPTDVDISGISGRLAWFDPDVAATLSIDSKTDSVDKIFDRVLGEDPPAGTPVLNSGGRRPKLVHGARGFGPSRSWVDYSPAHFWAEKNSNYGRTLRLNAAPTYSTTVVPLSARTVFVVQDSVKGGGSAFLSSVGGSGDILSRLTKWHAMQPDPGLPVWRDTTADVFKEGATYLDGREIDGAVEGFQGRPELLTAVGGRNFDLGAFGFYNYLQDVEDNVDYGEVQGEIIVYDRVLADADRGQIEAYLMWKWLGLAREGYSVASNMTVSGEGKVNVSSLTQMPKFASSFTGTAAMEESAYSFTIGADGSVAGKIDMGSAKMSLPASCTAAVLFTEGVKTGEYTLISCGGFVSDTEWTLNLSNATGRKVSLVSRNGALVLEVAACGTVLTIR